MLHPPPPPPYHHIVIQKHSFVLTPSSPSWIYIICKQLHSVTIMQVLIDALLACLPSPICE